MSSEKFDGLDLEQVRMLAEMGHTDKFMCDFFNVSRTTWGRWKRKHYNFLKKLKNWKAHADARVERSLYERAKGYEHLEEKVSFSKDGVVSRATVIKHYPPDTNACLNWLANRQPEHWRIKSERDINLNSDMGPMILRARAEKKAREKLKAEEAGDSVSLEELLE